MFDSCAVCHQGYLWTLKCCHSGADLDTAAEMSKGHMDDNTKWMLFDMLQNRYGGGGRGTQRQARVGFLFEEGGV